MKTKNLFLRYLTFSILAISLIANTIFLILFYKFDNDTELNHFDMFAFSRSADRMCNARELFPVKFQKICDYGDQLGNENDEISVSQPEEVSVSSPPRSDADIYAEEGIAKGFLYVDMHGYTISFPDSWAGYTSASRELDWGNYGTSDSMDFGFPVQDSLFNISVHTPQQWDDIHSEDGPVPAKISENDEYIFGYSVAQYVADDDMQDRMMEIRDIIDTFELIDLSAR
jgi:hypothetical protein